MGQPETVTVIHPAAEDRAAPIAARPRPARVAGAVVGLVDNARTNSDRFMRVLGAELERAGARVLFRRKPNPSVPLPDAALEELVGRCDIVVHGVAD